MKDVSNAKRFIEAYNLIDHSLRIQYNFKRGQSFGDMIRRCTSINSIIRKFEDILIDYARLRNAIIHNDNDDYVIAEPHDDVVERIEKIAELICKPPLVINTVCRKDLVVASAKDKVKDVLKLMYETGYSNIPVYENNVLVGVANTQRLSLTIGQIISNKQSIDDFMAKTCISEVLKKEAIEAKYYEIVSANLTIDQALDKFYTNRKLLALIVTKEGLYKERAIGIVTVGDIMDLNQIMDNYK
jgi:predicted transcriptional regulator